jgi:hypothetical protein
MQGTCSTLRTLRQLNPRHVLYPLGDGLLLTRGWRRHVAKQVAALRHGARFTPVGEKAVVAEADKAGREAMEQEAAQESMCVHRRLLQSLSLPTVALGEADLAITDVDQAGSRDGDAMRVAAALGDDLGRARTGGFGIHDPCGRIEVVEEVRKALRGGHSSCGIAEGQRGGRVGMRQGLEEFGPEDGP